MSFEHASEVHQVLDMQMLELPEDDISFGNSCSSSHANCCNDS